MTTLAIIGGTGAELAAKLTERTADLAHFNSQFAHSDGQFIRLPRNGLIQAGRKAKQS